MTAKENKGRVVSFRLTEEEFAPFQDKMQKAQINQSRFFRETFLQANPVFEEASKEYERLLFYFNKSSNNLNQIAHGANRAWNRGIVSEQVYRRILNELIHIRELLNAGVNNAD